LEQAGRSKELLVQYEHPKQKVQLEENLNEANRELARVKKEAKAEIVDYEFDFKSRETQLDLERQQFEKLKDQIEKGVMLAPSSGMVVYGREEGSRYGRGDPVQVGAEVRERQEVISIPSPGAMVAEMSLHESVLSQVSKGLPCRISVDAVPGLNFTGVIEFVSPLPDQNAWFANPNLRLFKTEVAIDETDSEDVNAQASLRELRPGMSCSIEVFVESVSDALFVPLQCVFFKDGHRVCFLKDGSGYLEREVKTGPHNTQIVVIESGVEEGDVVLMSAPVGALESESGRSNVPPKSFGKSSGEGRPAEAATGEASSKAEATKKGAGHAAGAPSGGATDGSKGGRPSGKGAGRPQGSGGRSGRPGAGG
jgi:HlyD family secretion protein